MFIISLEAYQIFYFSRIHSKDLEDTSADKRLDSYKRLLVEGLGIESKIQVRLVRLGRWTQSIDIEELKDLEVLHSLALEGMTTASPIGAHTHIEWSPEFRGRSTD